MMENKGLSIKSVLSGYRELCIKLAKEETWIKEDNIIYISPKITGVTDQGSVHFKFIDSLLGVVKIFVDDLEGGEFFVYPFSSTKRALSEMIEKVDKN